MDKYIKSDIEQGLTYLKIAIMNAISNIESGRKVRIVLGRHVPFSLVVQCAEERGWKITRDLDINGWECDCWCRMEKDSKTLCIISCLYKGLETEIYYEEET